MVPGSTTVPMPFRFGFSWVHNNFGFNQLSAPSGALSFSGTYTNNGTSSGGSGFADFLLGVPVSSTKSILPQGMPYVSYTDFGTYAQDTWRITPRLTAVFGLRYDLFTSPIDRKNRISNFVPDGGTISQIAGGTGQVVIADQGKYSRAIIQTRKLNFTPRVSLAYKLGNKTVRAQCLWRLLLRRAGNRIFRASLPELSVRPNVQHDLLIDRYLPQHVYRHPTVALQRATCRSSSTFHCKTQLLTSTSGTSPLSIRLRTLLLYAVRTSDRRGRTSA